MPIKMGPGVQGKLSANNELIHVRNKGGGSVNKTIGGLMALALLTLSVLAPVTSVVAAPAKESCNPSSLDLDFFKAIASEFGKIELSTCDIVNNREKRFGYGEMSIAQGLSTISGTSLPHVMQMRTEQKMGWGKIAKQLGVKVSDAVQRSASVLEKVGLSGEAARIRINIDLPDDDDTDDKNDKNDKHDHKPDKNKNHVPNKKQGTK